MGFDLKTLDLNRRRLTKSVNGLYILGRVPLLHTVILLVEMAVMSKLSMKFNQYYNARPVLTMMVTNAILGGIADTVAQSITAIRARAIQRAAGVANNDIEFRELDKRIPINNLPLLPNSSAMPPPFDFERMTRFMAYGFGMAPIQFKWFQFLSRAFPMDKGSSALAATMKRVAFDQLVYAPIGVGAFFVIMTIAEGGGKRAVTHKLRDMYMPTLKANYMVWPAVQVLNFRVIPLQFQLPFVSSVGIAWTAYLSLSNASEEVLDARSAPNSPNIRLT